MPSALERAAVKEQNARDEKVQVDADAVKRDAINQGLNNSLQNPGGGFTLYGNTDQLGNTAANLSQVGAMTGQNIFQTGSQQQDYYNSLQARRNGTDAVAQNMIDGRNRSLANTGRQFAGKGIAGGVAAAGMNTAQNQADSDINAQMQKNSKSNDQELWNYVKRNQKVTGEALAAGSDQGLASSMDTSAAEGAFGTVICTELHRQGYISDETLEQDAEWGDFFRRELPEVMAGYLFLASPIVKGMKKSKLFTKAVAFWAVPWAREMEGDANFRGFLVFLFGLPLCGLVGKFLLSKQAVA